MMAAAGEGRASVGNGWGTSLPERAAAWPEEGRGHPSAGEEEGMAVAWDWDSRGEERRKKIEVEGEPDTQVSHTSRRR
jgi:hypothetical protein